MCLLITLAKLSHSIEEPNNTLEMKQILSEPGNCTHVFITGNLFPFERCSLEDPTNQKLFTGLEVEILRLSFK